jgi:hypothetical protein
VHSQRKTSDVLLIEKQFLWKKIGMKFGVVLSELLQWIHQKVIRNQLKNIPAENLIWKIVHRKKLIGRPLVLFQGIHWRIIRNQLLSLNAIPALLQNLIAPLSTLLLIQ